MTDITLNGRESQRPGVTINRLQACPPNPQSTRGDSHDEGCNAYGPDVSLRDSALALQELRSWGRHR